MTNPIRYAAIAGAVLLLAACATPGIDDAVRQTNAAIPGFTQGKLALSRTADQAQARSRLSEELLSQPLDMEAAVRLALANSPALQGLVAERWGDIVAADQSGRIGNPVFTFERTRIRDELELGRLLSIGLLDLLTLPQRRVLSRNQGEQARLQLTAGVVEQIGHVRQAWVRAVATRQSLEYAEQVNKAAQAGAELARRMQQVGNFTRLQRARQQVFYADATAQLASAQHAALSAREELVRQLGLTDAQAERLQLPERLPELPAQPRSAQQLTAAALQQRLDVQLARLQLDAAGQAQGLKLLNSLVDVELGLRHDTVFDQAGRANRNGYELAIKLPLFDFGDAQRTALNARSLAAVNRYESVTRSASSQLRERYSAYRTAYDLARHYRDEIVPLRKTMQEENVLRYNGMLIGVFELLAETREQIAAVMAAIDAQQQFWLADAAMSSTLIGTP
jgi:outer membrane protein TolC